MPMRSSTSALSIRLRTIRSVWRTLFVIGSIDSPEHGALEPCDDWQSPRAARPPQQQRPVFVGGHGEADGLVDPPKPGGTLVLGRGVRPRSPFRSWIGGATHTTAVGR